VILTSTNAFIAGAVGMFARINPHKNAICVVMDAKHITLTD